VLIQKIRKVLGWLSVIALIGVLIIVVTAKKETVAEGIVVPHMWFLLGTVANGVCL